MVAKEKESAYDHTGENKILLEAGAVLAQERRMRILELLQEEGSARVSYLSGAFGVSEPTIRQDLERLENEGQIVREHGGAYLRSVSSQVRSLSLQHVENMGKKSAIARRAAEFINDGDRMILDSGSTVTEISKLLKGHKDLTLVTNALNIALIVLVRIESSAVNGDEGITHRHVEVAELRLKDMPSRNQDQCVAVCEAHRIALMSRSSSEVTIEDGHREASGVLRGFSFEGFLEGF